MNDKILVVENNTRFITGILAVLDELRFTSRTHIIGVEETQPVGGVLRVFDGKGNRTSIRLNEYVIALVDGIAYGDIRIWDIVRLLKAQGIECVGISNMFYDLLRRSGATVSPDRKPVFDFLRKELPALYAAAREKMRY
jgi:hypothetical protein